MYPSSMRGIPSGSTLFNAYASLSSAFMLIRSAVDNFLPPPAKAFIYSFLRKLFTRSRPDEITLIVDEFLPGGAGLSRNEVFDAAQSYLSTRISPDAKSLRVSKSAGSKNIAVTFVEKERIKDEFQGVALQWRYSVTQTKTPSSEPLDPYARHGASSAPKEKQSFTLKFQKQRKQLILDSYLPHILERAQQIRDDVRVLKLHTLDRSHGYAIWQSVNLEHPASFDTLAMEPAMKEAVIRDLDTFRSRRDFYRRVGRAWKRGYLLYGPPGTGKSSLVAAIANYLKFDIYDLQLSSITSDADLRRALIATGNRSVLVIEDIDCSCDLPDRDDKKKSEQNKMTLSGLLNFIDGLWSSCGDERIIVFTTNHKEKLDPTLLRPGRMDMHIHMSYLTKQGFKVLANNYLGITNGESHGRLCEEVGGLIEEVQVSPAQVAEELMVSGDVGVALERLVNMLKKKRDQEDEVEDMKKKMKMKKEGLEEVGDKDDKHDDDEQEENGQQHLFGANLSKIVRIPSEDEDILSLGIEYPAN